MSLSDEQVLDRLQEGFAAAARAVPLPTPRWSGPPERRQPERSPRRVRFTAVAASLLLLAGTAVVVTQQQRGADVVARGPAPPQGVGRVQLPADPGPRGTWEPGTGPGPGLGEVVSIASDPVTSATVAVQKGSGSRWWWVVAGAGDRRLRVALDSSRQAPAALTRDGRRLAVAFPGIVRVVDLVTGVATSVETGPAAGGEPRTVSWSPDGTAVAVLRHLGDPQAIPRGPSTIEVAGPGRAARRFSALDVPGGVAWSPDGARLATTHVFPIDVRGELSGRTQVVDLATGTATFVPPAPGLVVGWQGSTLVRSAAGSRSDTGPRGGPTTTVTGPDPEGTVVFLDVDGRELRRIATPQGFLAQLGPPFDPAGRFGLVTPRRSGGEDPYAVVVDLADGTVVGELRDRRSVPYVLGLGTGTVTIAEELAGRFEVKAVDWTTGRAAPLCTLPFRDEGFTFAAGLQAVVPA